MVGGILAWLGDHRTAVNGEPLAFGLSVAIKVILAGLVVALCGAAQLSRRPVASHA